MTAENTFGPGAGKPAFSFTGHEHNRGRQFLKTGMNSFIQLPRRWSQLSPLEKARKRTRIEQIRQAALAGNSHFIKFPKPGVTATKTQEVRTGERHSRPSTPSATEMPYAPEQGGTYPQQHTDDKDCQKHSEHSTP